MKKRRALILYATMTGNTEKIARWFDEVFRYYSWETEMIRLKPGMDWPLYEGKTYFDDYDIICLGSPIVAGAPLKPVADYLGLNGDGVNFQKSVEKRMNGESADDIMSVTRPGSRWRRTSAPYPGIYNKNNSRPSASSSAPTAAALPEAENASER